MFPLLAVFGTSYSIPQVCEAGAASWRRGLHSLCQVVFDYVDRASSVGGCVRLGIGRFSQNYFFFSFSKSEDACPVRAARLFKMYAYEMYAL